MTVDRKTEIFAESRSIFRWRPAAWLRVSGADAAVFLQGQLTNDLRGLGADGAIYGLWLNHKGRVLADSFVLRGRKGEFWVGSYFSSATKIREHLESFIVADDVAIEDVTANWCGVTVLGAVDGIAGESREVFVFSGRRSAEPGCELVFPDTLEEAVLARFAGARELDAAEMERRRIGTGIPAVPADIGPGELPNEGGLEDVAISYTKGCYLGQEVMARLKTMGQVRRRLRRVRGGGAMPQLPAAVFQGGRKIGELRSAARDGEGFVGLALVSLLNLRRDAALSFSAEDEAGAMIFSDTP